MDLEGKIAEFITSTKFEDLPKEPVKAAKRLVFTIIGTIIAGATEEGCDTIVNMVKEWGGKEEATILIHGGKVPAYNAVFANSTMARALDICDHMFPGLHTGSSSVPTALASAELTGGCSGKDFLTALIVGGEVASRINAASHYNGFDPTGVCAIFATAAITGKMLHLNSTQMLNALALAFNKSGGSYQSNIDGSLAVRVVQGFVSQGGIICAQLAQQGVTGPKNFLKGIYGYFHLYAKDQFDEQALMRGLGDRFEMTEVGFKSYPCCGGITGSLDSILPLVKEGKITPEDVAQIDIKLTPPIYNVVGHPFKIGENPTVDAQFSVQYCVANALLRKDLKLHHFRESYIRDPKIKELSERIHVSPGIDLDPRRPELLCKTEVKVTTTHGTIYSNTVDTPSGFPGNPLTDEEHRDLFQDHVSYGGKPIPKENVTKLVSIIDRLEELQDVRHLIPLLTSEG
jgi:2-methylcitrate dehydratase PrpD